MSGDGDLIWAYERDSRRRGLQPTTIASHNAFLRRFAGRVAGGMLDATPDDVERFLDAYQLGATARYQYISGLHAFFDWARRAGYGNGDPTIDIIRPKLPKRLPRPISNADLGVALEMASARVRSILVLGAFQGMRCIEIARLCREDVLDGNEPPVVVAYGKGAKDRVIPLHPDTLSALRLLPMPKAGPVFRLDDGTGRQARAHNIGQWANRYLEELGIDATMHCLRHWFGTHIYRTSGYDLLMVADLMGHASVDTSMIYARFDRARAPEAVLALSANPIRSTQPVSLPLDDPAA